MECSEGFKTFATLLYVIQVVLNGRNRNILSQYACGQVKPCPNVEF
jgi:hypothetical protein